MKMKKILTALALSVSLISTSVAADKVRIGFSTEP